MPGQVIHAILISEILALLQYSVACVSILSKLGLPRTIMSEAQPLLVHDPETPHTKPAKPSWRARTAQFLENPILHKSVIALVSYSNTRRTPLKILK